MSLKRLREDLMLAAYAVSHGFELKGEDGISPPIFDGSGVPPEDLQFLLRTTIKGTHTVIKVWCTERGWRVARMELDHKWTPPKDIDFHRHLIDALARAQLVHARREQ